MLRASLLLILLSAAYPYAAVSSGPTVWKGGNGNWDDGAKWSAGLPNTFGEATIGGASDVAIPPGDFTTAALRVGTEAGDRAKVEVNGANLLIRQDSLIVGELSGGVAQFVLNGGSVESAMDIFVGGATASTGRMNRSSLVIKDGRLIGLSLTAGEGLGSDSTIEIDGSRSAAISALEFVEMRAFSDPGGKPAITTLGFTLDEHGVTPIVIQSRWQGLRVSHDNASHCRLSIRLNAVPPREDITLISSRSPTQGIFDALPEGSEVSAEYHGHMYLWRLTYQGGESGHDLVLANRSSYPPGAPVTHTLAPQPAPVPRWFGHPVYPLTIRPGRAAFPGAQGYGASAAGGRAGRKIYVTNLNDSGPGSLRSAVTASGPRIVVFRTGGSIALKSTLNIRNPYLTIDGSNAPGHGIMLRDHGIIVRTHDVILRQFRIRIGDQDVRRNDPNIRYDAGDGEYALYFIDGAHDDLADHLSLSWATNKILSTTKLSDRITVQWCILSESLNIDGHGYASLAGGNRVTWHHNLFAHNFSRNPRFQGAVDADFRNNVVYDWGEKSTYGEFDRLNFVGNYFKPGPSTIQRPPLFHDGLAFVAPGSLYLNGNVLEGDEKASEDNWKGSPFYFDRKRIAASAPFPAPAVTNDTALGAFHKVLAEAGATRPHRDAVDNRVVHEVREGRGRIIESTREVGGWPDFQ
jgi:pectate lyase